MAAGLSALIQQVEENLDPSFASAKGLVLMEASSQIPCILCELGHMVIPIGCLEFPLLPEQECHLLAVPLILQSV